MYVSVHIQIQTNTQLCCVKYCGYIPGLLVVQCAHQDSTAGRAKAEESVRHSWAVQGLGGVSLSRILSSRIA